MQELEEQKLRITVNLQLARQRAQDCSPENEQKSVEKVRDLLRSLNSVVEHINDSMEEVRYRMADLRDEQT